MKAARMRGLLVAVEYFERAMHEDSTFGDARYQIAKYHLRHTNASRQAMEHCLKTLLLDKSGQAEAP